MEVYANTSVEEEKRALTTTIRTPTKLKREIEQEDSHNNGDRHISTAVMRKSTQTRTMMQKHPQHSHKEQTSWKGKEYALEGWQGEGRINNKTGWKTIELYYNERHKKAHPTKNSQKI